MLAFKTGDDFMRYYEVYTTDVPFSALIGIILRGIGIPGIGKRELGTREGEFRTEEGWIVQTSKTKRGIERYQNRRGREVLSIAECTRAEGQKVPTI